MDPKSRRMCQARQALVSLLAVFAVGCATTPGDCDPTSRDFFKNTSCLATGAYGQRQRDMEATLAQERARNASFRAVLAALETEQAQVKDTLAARQADYARLDAAWRELRQGLAAESRTNAELAARLDALDDTVSARKANDASADVAARTAARDNLRLQVSLLEKELEAGIY